MENSYVFKFGKYKGRRLVDVYTYQETKNDKVYNVGESYLDWLLVWMSDKPRLLKDKELIETELKMYKLSALTNPQLSE